MGFGIKTKTIKVINRAVNYAKHPVNLFNKLTNGTFPKHPYSKFLIDSRLNSAIYDLKDDDLTHHIGLLSPKVDKYAAQIYQKFVAANGNNIGNWSMEAPLHGTRQLEYEVVQKLIDLYKAKSENIEGYVTSGGTEGNLFSVWVGKAHVMKKYRLNQVCLFKTSFTHYSVDKACLMYSMKYYDIPLDKDTWIMDPNSLEKEVNKQVEKGVYGFVIFLTFGYTETGTSDNLSLIVNKVNKLKKLHKKIVFSIIIDGAFNGLIEPFLKKDFRPFISQDVHLFSVDFSKFTAVPYPAGVVLYRNKLRDVIEQEVKFFPVPDNTLLGSRPGASAAAIWGTIHLYGISGYKAIILRQLEVKKYFINQILKLFPRNQIITNPYGLTCGVVFDKKQFKPMQKMFEDQYRVYAKEEDVLINDGLKHKMIICKFFFLQHMTKKSVDDIILTIKNLKTEKRML